MLCVEIIPGRRSATTFDDIYPNSKSTTLETETETSHTSSRNHNPKPQVVSSICDPDPEYETVFTDTFSGTTLDSNVWTVTVGDKPNSQVREAYGTEVCAAATHLKTQTKPKQSLNSNSNSCQLT